MYFRLLKRSRSAFGMFAGQYRMWHMASCLAFLHGAFLPSAPHRAMSSFTFSNCGHAFGGHAVGPALGIYNTFAKKHHHVTTVTSSSHCKFNRCVQAVTSSVMRWLPGQRRNVNRVQAETTSAARRLSQQVRIFNHVHAETFSVWRLLLLQCCYNTFQKKHQGIHCVPMGL